MNYKKNARYFEKGNALAVVLLYLLTVAITVVGILFWFVLKAKVEASQKIYVLVGIILTAVGGAAIVALTVATLVKALSRPSDQQIDGVYQSLADLSVDAALENAGFSEDAALQAKPVVLSSCLYENIFTPFRIKVGRDGVMRSSNFSNFVLLFDSDQILIYRNNRSIIREEWQYSLSEYYYHDIVSLTTTVSTETVTGKGGEHVVRKETLHLVTSSGTEIELPFQDNAAAKEAILQLRQILRSKKKTQVL